jgi:hypothetical protein
MRTLLIGKMPNFFAVRLTLLAPFLLVLVSSVVGWGSHVGAQSAMMALGPRYLQ